MKIGAQKRQWSQKVAKVILKVILMLFEMHMYYKQIFEKRLFLNKIVIVIM